MFSLVPIYLVSFVFVGALLILLSKRVPDGIFRACLRWTGIAAGPIFLLVILAFTGWERDRTYEMEWLVGNSARRYLATGLPEENTYEYPVVLERTSGRNHDCFVVFDSKSMTQYLRARPDNTVRVQYRVTYDFFKARNIQLRRVAEFGPTSDLLLHELRQDAERSGPDSRRISCFGW